MRRVVPALYALPMATPERRTTNLPAVATPAAGPVPVVGPLGWVLTLAAGIGLILATWVLYPGDYDGMWAGYRDGIIGTVVILAAMVLNTSLPAKPALGVLGLCGVLLVLFAVFLDDSTKVFVTELTAGIVLLVGTGMQASASRR
jgi:hypothetical protein